MTVVPAAEAGPRSELGSLRVSTLLFLLIVVNLLVGGMVTLLRLFAGWEWVSNYNKLINPLLILIAGLVLAQRRPIRLDSFLVIAGSVIPVGILVGLMRGGHLRAFLSHVAVALFAWTLYAAGRAQDRSSSDLERFARVASIAIVAIYGFVEAIFWGSMILSGEMLYFGISTGDVLLPFCLFFVRRRWGLAALSALLIVAGGNRGAVIALFFVFVMALPLPGRRRLALRLVLGLVVALMLLGASFLLDSQIRAFDVPPTAERLWSKWMLFNPLRPEFDPRLASGGRYDEVSYAFEAFRSLPAAWLVGGGYGWSYANRGDLWNKVGSGEEFVAHYVHLSPMNYLLLYGLPLALLLLGAIWWSASRSYRRALVEMGPHSVEYALALYVVGTLVWGLTIYTWSVNPMLWIVMGALAGRSAGTGASAQAR